MDPQAHKAKRDQLGHKASKVTLARQGRKASKVFKVFKAILAQQVHKVMLVLLVLRAHRAKHQLFPALLVHKAFKVTLALLGLRVILARLAQLDLRAHKAHRVRQFRLRAKYLRLAIFPAAQALMMLILLLRTVTYMFGMVRNGITWGRLSDLLAQPGRKA